MSSARRISVIASVPVPTPTAYGTWLAAANSRSNASTSGPSTNQPLASTRSIAAFTSAASSAGFNALNGTVTDIPGKILAVVIEGPRETLAQLHRRFPSGAGAEQRRVRVEAADVYGLLVRGPLDERVASAAGDLDQHLDEIAMRDVLF